MAKRCCRIYDFLIIDATAPLFLPSIMLSGIMFPAQLLPDALEKLGRLFPATWGYQLLGGGEAELSGYALLLTVLAGAAGLCCLLLRRSRCT